MRKAAVGFCRVVRFRSGACGFLRPRRARAPAESHPQYHHPNQVFLRHCLLLLFSVVLFLSFRIVCVCVLRPGCGHFKLVALAEAPSVLSRSGPLCGETAAHSGRVIFPDRSAAREQGTAPTGPHWQLRECGSSAEPTDAAMPSSRVAQPAVEAPDEPLDNGLNDLRLRHHVGPWYLTPSGVRAR